jgi:hypothetical protein
VRLRAMKWGIAPIIVALGLVAAGCGSTVPVHRHSTPTPLASAKATPKASTGLTLAQASSHSYTVSFPLVNCSTLSTAAQAAWGYLMIGSPINECAPASFLAKDIPQHVTVINDDSAISQSKANAYGQALVNSLAWFFFAYHGDDPAILPVLGLSTGNNALVYQALASGYRMIGTSQGNAVFPNSITVVPLNSSNQTLLDSTKNTFALVVSYGQQPFSITGQFSGQAAKTTPNPANTPSIFDGTIVSSVALGNYFQVDTYSDNCASGPTSGICQAAGVS